MTGARLSCECCQCGRILPPVLASKPAALHFCHLCARVMARLRDATSDLLAQRAAVASQRRFTGEPITALGDL